MKTFSACLLLAVAGPWVFQTSGTDLVQALRLGASQSSMTSPLRGSNGHAGRSGAGGVPSSIKIVRNLQVYDCNSIDCDDGNDLTVDTCDSNVGCQNLYDCNSIDCDDGNDLTIDTCDINVGCQSLYDCDNGVCDDGNDLTIDTCDINDGCTYQCHDGNACTKEEFVDGVCVYVDDCDETDTAETCTPGLIDCDDGLPTTIDYCDRSLGCKFLGFDDDATPDEIIEGIDMLPEDAYFYEDLPTLSVEDLGKIVNWLKIEVTGVRTPFCWKDSYGRGVGVIPSQCPSDRDRILELCYPKCESGYSRGAGLDCLQNCKAGWRDDGLYCRFEEYSRGAGFPWQFGDALNLSGALARCEIQHGSGNCEQDGLVIYPKCLPGYTPQGCCICAPSFSSCGAEGYDSSGQIGLSCKKKNTGGALLASSLQCKDDEFEDTGLCYATACQDGYYNGGPVCWQYCDADIYVDCGAGCASDTETCASEIADQVIAPFIVLANILTLGIGSIGTTAGGSAVKAVKIGNEFYKYSTKAGKFMLSVMKKLQTVQSKAVPAKASLVKRFKILNFGSTKKKIATAKGIAANVWAAGDLMRREFSDDFVVQTSPAIANEVDSKLDPIDAAVVKRYWGEVMQEEMAEQLGFEIAQIALSTVSVVDITGVTALVAAYTKPVCLVPVPFPDLTNSDGGGDNGENPPPPVGNVPPNAVCSDTTLSASTSTNCQAAVAFRTLGAGSFDSEGTPLRYSIDGLDPSEASKTYMASSESYSYSLVVYDGAGVASDECQGSVTVVDDSILSLQCSEATYVDATQGTCGASVEYDSPEIAESCLLQSSLELKLLNGLESGGFFPKGETTLQFELFDGSSTLDTCEQKVIVSDKESPVLNCGDLERTNLSTDTNKCTAWYQYTDPPVSDNCDENVSLTKSGGLGFNPFVFPLGTTTTVYEAVDESLNRATCQFDVTVYDNQVPEISCNDLAVTLANDPRECSAVHSYTEPVGGDNCEIASTYLTEGISSGGTFPVGMTKNEYKTTDSSGNTATCFFQVLVEDREKPTISCPTETIRMCGDIDPAVTGTPDSWDNCEVVSITKVDDSNDGLTTDSCNQITTRTWTSSDSAGNSISCDQKIVEVSPTIMTDSSLCLNENDGIRNIYTPDRSRPEYFLRSTNPGQVVYHAFYTGTAGASVSMSLDIPYPFVTRGDHPVQARDWLDLVSGNDGRTCLKEGAGQVFYESSEQIHLDDYAGGAQCGSTTNLSVQVTVPASGFVHLSLDLAFGLLGEAEPSIGLWAQYIVQEQVPPQSIVNSNPSQLLFPNECPMSFTATVPQGTTTTTLVNTNVYKVNHVGVGGFVTDAFFNPVAGVAVELTKQNTNVVGTATTDADGWYDIAYKHKGKRANYEVKVGAQSSTIEMKGGNGVQEVNFTV